MGQNNSLWLWLAVTESQCCTVCALPVLLPQCIDTVLYYATCNSKMQQGFPILLVLCCHVTSNMLAVYPQRSRGENRGRTWQRIFKERKGRRKMIAACVCKCNKLDAFHRLKSKCIHLHFMVKEQERDNEKDRGSEGGERCLGSGWGSFQHLGLSQMDTSRSLPL